jgi:hypothetical protein
MVAVRSIRRHAYIVSDKAIWKLAALAFYLQPCSLASAISIVDHAGATHASVVTNSPGIQSLSRATRRRGAEAADHLSFADTAVLI